MTPPKAPASGKAPAGAGEAGTPWPLRALRIIHPFPTLLNVAATAGLAFVAAGTPDASRLARMLAVMFLIQSCIGIVNDVYDRELDAVAKPSKPIPSGAVSLAAARWAAWVAAAAAAAVGATLGPASLALAALGLACGLVYDVRLKRTPFSALPFMVAIPTLPLWVWVTLDEWEPVLWWMLPLGALIGLSIHLANTLPDIEDDRAFGVRGLAHRLGRRASVAVAWSSFAAALGLAAVIAPFVDGDSRLYASAVGFGAAALAAPVASYGVLRSERALQFGFGALGAGAAVAAVGWLAAVT